MKSFLNTPQLSVYRIGEAARDILKSGSQGRVLAVFSNAVYLRSLSGELFWLVTDKIPMHRRGIQIPGTLPRVTADSSFSVRGQHLLLGSNIDLDLSAASIWVSPRPKFDEHLPFEDLPDRLRAIICLFDDFPPPTGFGSILLEITRNTVDYPLPAAFPDNGLALKHARPALNEILLACIANDFSRILGTAENLIGLGEGLTPSGDDFIGGLLFSSLTIQKIYTQYQGFTLSDVEFFLEYSRNRTNLISYTLLKDHAAGHASDTLHRFINAILTDKHLESTYYFGLELVRIGHSTGWDLLTGVWMGILLSLGSRAALSCSLYDSTSSRI
jgi:hypothetical protein